MGNIGSDFFITVMRLTAVAMMGCSKVSLGNKCMEKDTIKLLCLMVVYKFESRGLMAINEWHMF